MNVAYLLNRYFKNCGRDVLIEVFDDKNIYSVYTDIVKGLSNNPNVELGVMQALSYCFYEILDNVLTHSEKNCGTAILHFNASSNRIVILVADDGIGIEASLKQNKKYADVSPADALRLCIRDNVTDGKGMGFGLFSTSMLIEHAGVMLTIHSGKFILNFDGKDVVVSKTDDWQGTILCFELKSDIELDSKEILDGRVDAESEFNDAFMDSDELDNLW